MNDAPPQDRSPESVIGSAGRASQQTEGSGRGRLLRKYVSVVAGVVLVALVANGAMDALATWRDHQAALVRIQQGQAEAAAEKIGRFVREIEAQLGWTTLLPWANGTTEARWIDAQRLLKQVPAISGFTQIDGDGHERLRISRLEPDVYESGLDLSKDPKFVRAMEDGVYYGPVYFRRESEPYMTLAVAGLRHVNGVSVAEVNLKFVWDVVSRISVGKDGLVYVVDRKGRLMAHPDIGLVLRQTDMSELSHVRAALDGQAGTVTPEAVDFNGMPVLSASAPVAPLGWTVFVELPVAEAYAPLYSTIERNGLILLVTLALAVSSGALLAHRMVAPIRVLGDGAARIGAGELSQRIDIHTGDELEDLAERFNDMAARLQESYAGLERKVEERTSELAGALERQTATADLLRVISSSPTDVQPVFDMIARSSGLLCAAEITVVLTLEDDVLHYVASHGLSPEGVEAQRRAFPMALDRSTAAGRAIMSGAPAHIPEIEADPDYKLVQLARDVAARSVSSVPILRGDQPIGAITVMRAQMGLLPDRQIDLLRVFADQAVIAIENVRLFTELEARNRDLTAALERQTATAEVLNVINRSKSDLQPVLDTIARISVRLCQSEHAAIWRLNGDRFELAAHTTPDATLASYFTANPVPTGRGSLAGRAVLERGTLHIADAQTDPELSQLDQLRRSKTRTMLAVPLISGDQPLGVITLTRRVVKPFTRNQITLITTFADQAVIAIENVRLFTQLEARNRDLTEALDRQTATSEVLAVISRSQSDLQPVLDTIVTTAARLCHAEWALIHRLGSDGRYHLAAHSRAGDALVRYMLENPVTPDRGKLIGRTIIESKAMHVADVLKDPDYTWHEAQELGGYRTAMSVPLLRGDTVIGVIALAHNVVRPFSDSEIDLVTTFADQAVIAIENVRLFTELDERTRDLSESLEQQTATSDILRVISSSPTDVQPVFDMIAERAAQLCSAQFCHVFRYEDGLVHFVANCGLTPEARKAVAKRWPMPPDEGNAAGRAILRATIVEITDVQKDVSYVFGDIAKVVTFRSIVGVPILRDGAAVGAITVMRSEPGRFLDRQRTLLQTFADQAVIAVENVRMFTELETRNVELARSVDELRALGEVSQAVNSTLDIETVLATIVAKAVQLSGSDAGSIYVFDRERDEFRLRANYGLDDGMIAALRGHRVRIGETAVGSAAAERRPVQITDVGDAPHAKVPEVILRAGFRAFMVVPLLGADNVVGALVVRRKAVGNFAQSTVELLQTFATQSVLAIQNARLFREIAEKSLELEVASHHKSQFLANMSHELRTPLNAILGYSELILDDIYGEPPEKMRRVLERVQSNGRHLLGLINDVLDLSKIEAGQLTLSLTNYSLADVLQSVHSAVEALAAEKKLAFRVDAPPNLPVGHGDERRLTQVLLNLVGNAIKFTDAGEVTIEASAANGTFRVAVRDTGPGIAAEDQMRIFDEFQQVDVTSTRQKGGSGLGLAISKRIVEMHGGRIWVDSEPDKGSTFTVSLPVTVERQAETP